MIRGKFNSTPLGRTLSHMADAITRALAEERFQAAADICHHAEGLTADPQWRAVRLTLAAIGLAK